MRESRKALGKLFVVLGVVVFVLVIRFRLVEDAAQEDADEIQQHHGERHHALGHDIGRGDHGCNEEDADNGDASGFLEQIRVDDAHFGQDDRDQRHLKHTAKDHEHRQTEVDIALDTGGGLDVISALNARAQETEHERHHQLVGKQHAHAEQCQAQQDDQLEEERLALFQAGLCKGVHLIQRHRHCDDA